MDRKAFSIFFFLSLFITYRLLCSLLFFMKTTHILLFVFIFGREELGESWKVVE